MKNQVGLKGPAGKMLQKTPLSKAFRAAGKRHSI